MGATNETPKAMPLRERVAKAIWEADGDELTWDKLDPEREEHVKREILTMADAAMEVLRAEWQVKSLEAGPR